MTTSFSRMVCLLAWLVVAGMAEAAVYDGNNILPFKGRTKEDVAAKYLEARKARGTYRSDDRTTWYEVMPSTEYPYAAGVLTQDAHNIMSAMTNFYRWLVGVETMRENSTHSDILQAGALIRNFDFNHSVSLDLKPQDMSLDLWNYGASCPHNILAYTSNPRGSITLWLNEGYIVSQGKWDYGGGRASVGHRTALISGYNSGVQFGFSGNVAIGDVIEYGNYFEGAFSAFPAPGYMPRDKIWHYDSAWNVLLNNEFLSAKDKEYITVTVTELSSGSSYTCTEANGKLGPCGQSLIVFAQPLSADTDGSYSGEYRVDVTGLTDKVTGNDAALTYTVKFMTLPPAIEMSTNIKATSGRNFSKYLNTADSEADEWRLTGGALPEGVRLARETSSQGFYWWHITGTAAEAGVYSFTLEASNEYGTDSADFTLTVEDEEPSFSGENLRIAGVDMSYSGYVLVDGSRPLILSVSEGTFPPGLSLSDDGTITGVPTKAGEYSFTITATNKAGSASKDFTITAAITKPVLSARNLSRNKLTAGTSYSLYLYAEGSRPFTWSVTAGNLPGGMVISGNDNIPDAGVIQGTPTTTGKFTFTVRASNSAGYDEEEYTLEVDADPNPTPTISQDPTPTPTPTPIISQDPTPTRDSEANKIRALMGRGENVPFTRITGRTEQYAYYDDGIVAVLEGMNVAETGIYLIQNITLRVRVPAGSYLVWHNDATYGALLGAADNDCVFLDDYSNEITMPTASDMYHISAAVYLEGGRTYSPYITADYRTNTNTEPKQGESEGGGGGCGGFISATALAVLLLWRKR